MRTLAVLVLVGCGGAGAAGPPERDDPAAAADLAGYRALFEIRWGGAPVGEARERLDPVPGGFRFERRERWLVARGAALVAGEVAIAIATTAELEPTRVEVRGATGGVARRAGAGWRIEVAGEGARGARGLPLEILPLWMARRGLEHWSGDVFLPGLGFAPARAVVEPAGEGRRLVQISGPAGNMSIAVALQADGTVARAIGPDLSAHRVTSISMTPSPPPDVVAAGAVEVAGDPSAGAPVELETLAGRRLVLTPHRPVADCSAPGCPPAVPDPPPSPAIHRLADRLARGAASPADEIARLARGTANLLEGDLAAGSDADAARVAARRRADCVGHAALFAALARARGHTVRLVTGYRLDGRRLVRHAWATVFLADTALEIDPTTGEPAGAGYFPLAVHGSAAAEVALAGELAYAGLTGARARFTDPRSARSTPRTP